jgi:hypothetical protein
MPKTTAQRSATYRERQRAKGLRKVTIWVPDTRNPAVKAAIERDVAAINAARLRPGERSVIETVEGWLLESEDWKA